MRFNGRLRRIERNSCSSDFIYIFVTMYQPNKKKKEKEKKNWSKSVQDQDRTRTRPFYGPVRSQYGLVLVRPKTQLLVRSWSWSSKNRPRTRPDRTVTSLQVTSLYLTHGSHSAERMHRANMPSAYIRALVSSLDLSQFWGC